MINDNGHKDYYDDDDDDREYSSSLYTITVVVYVFMNEKYTIKGNTSVSYYWMSQKYPAIQIFPLLQCCTESAFKSGFQCLHVCSKPVLMLGC